MNKPLLTLFTLALLVLVSGCAPLAATAPTLPLTATTPPTDIPPTLTPRPTITPLEIERLKNTEYRLPQYDRTVTLIDGGYESGSETDPLGVRLLDPIAFGDLNGDGLDDAAVLLAENAGGSGVFVSVVVVLNQGGQPVQSGAALIDDRPNVTALSIQNDQVIVEALRHGPNDAMCCPTFAVTETYQLFAGQIELVRLSSQTPTGATRAIRIESPAAEAEVSGSVQARGSVTMAPFENSLAYHLVDRQGNVLAEGPVPVTAADLGRPGTFDAPLDLAAIPAGTAVRLEILDLSAADGSWLAMDSVRLIVK